MISYLKGKVKYIDENQFTLDVNGVGYEIITGSKTLKVLGILENAEIEIPIYTSVKENQIQLLGFPSFIARKIFSILIHVNGLGPKIALQITDQLTPQEIIQAVSNKNSLVFLNINGIGKKTAQRILLDLEGKFESMMLQNDSVKELPTSVMNTEKKLNSLFQETKSALINLGFNEKNSEAAIKKYWREDITFNELIKICLKEFSKT